MADTTTVKGSQFKQPLLEFSGSCAGCAETAYPACVIPGLRRPDVYLQRHRLLLHLGRPAATSPYTVNKQGKGPAWANSLFEDNAEHGLGFYYGQKALRDRLTEQTQGLLAIDYADRTSRPPARSGWIPRRTAWPTLRPPRQVCGRPGGHCLPSEGQTAAGDACKLAREILAHKEFLAKKSIWIFGGDGWAYDIGFGGLDHVLASGEDVNVMVF